MKLDKADFGLLSALDINARQSYNQLAKRVGVSKEVAQYRIKRLENGRIIEGYYALVDFAALGYILIRVYIKLQSDSAAERTQMVADLVALPYTLTVYTTDFAWDIAIGFMTKSFKDFDSIWSQFETQYRRVIAKINISVVFEFVHYHRKYLSPRKSEEVKTFTSGVSPVKDLDSKDLRILKALAKNAKTPVVKLARQIGITPSAVIYKIRKLEKEKVILTYRANIDFNKLNYEYYKVDLELDNLTVKPRISSYLRQHKNVTFEDRTIGGSDLEFDIEVPEYEDFVKLIEEIKAAFPGAIRRYTFYRARKIHKYLYVPENYYVII